MSPYDLVESHLAIYFHSSIPHLCLFYPTASVTLVIFFANKRYDDDMMKM